MNLFFFRYSHNIFKLFRSRWGAYQIFIDTEGSAASGVQTVLLNNSVSSCIKFNASAIVLSYGCLPAPSPLALQSVESDFFTASTTLTLSITFAYTLSQAPPQRTPPPAHPWYDMLGNGPAGIAQNLSLWLDAQNISASTTRVERWVDRSGMGNDAVQTSSSWQPLYIADCLSGLPCVSFDGSSTFLEGNLKLPEDKTIFVVFKDTGSHTQCCSGLVWFDSCNGLSTKSSGGGDVYLSIDWPGSGSTGDTNILNKSVVATLTYNSSKSEANLWACSDATQGSVCKMST